MTFYDQVAQNKRNTLLIITAFVMVVSLSVYIFSYLLESGPGMTIFALALSFLSAGTGYFFGDSIILAISGARPADKGREFDFYSVAENLSLGVGLSMPTLYVIQDSAPNAFATGHDPNHAVVCATTGLLEKLDRTELEAVIAHELSHVKNYDIRLMMIVSVLVGMVALLADWFNRRALWGFSGRRKRDNESAFGIFVIVGLVLAIFAPIFAKLIQLALSRQREYLADASAVALTRQPSGLISALKKISADQEPLEAANRATAHLYIVNPFKGDFGGKVVTLFSTHPPIEERIKRLEALI